MKYSLLVCLFILCSCSTLKRSMIGGALIGGLVGGGGGAIFSPDEMSRDKNAYMFGVIGAAAGAFPPDALTPMGVPVDVTAVIAASLMGSIVGTIGYFILTRVLTLKLARQIFIGGMVLALIGMFFGPFGIPNAPVLQIILLEIMHFVVGGALWYFLAKS